MPPTSTTLAVAWEWNGEIAPGVTAGADINARSLPIYVDGMLLTTSGERRTVVSLDPATGKTLWSFQEPLTPRHEYSMRSNHGKGVTYARINGRGVVFMTSPGFFLHALDAKTGKPIEGWGGTGAGRRVPGNGNRRSAQGLDRRLGSVERGEAALRRGQGPAARTRLHHDVFAADRRQRRAHRRQLRRTGLQPDAHRERAGRHPGV